MTEYAIDYAFARPSPSAIRAAGYTGVLRYVCPVNSQTAGKIISPTEAAAIRAAGLDLTLNFEWYETRPRLGYSAGVADAKLADEQADAVGYPLECAIYYSVDFGATWGEVAEYFRGVHTASRRPVGVYGGLPIIRAAQVAGYARYGWVTNAASWSGRTTWSQVAAEARANPDAYHLLQHLHSNTPAHVAGVDDTVFDPNTVLNPSYGQWRAAGQTERLFMDTADVELLRAETNRTIGTLQTNMKDEWIPAIVTAVTKAVVKAVSPYRIGAVDVDAIAKAAADEVAERLSNG